MTGASSESLFRVYAADECGADGYPFAWHEAIKHDVRSEAGHRCIRCGHPYRNGEHGNGEWSACDDRCSHGGPARDLDNPFSSLGEGTTTGALIRDAHAQGYRRVVEAQWRILTVHHLDGDKANCRWWNLVALCQRCHLEIQGRVKMECPWPWEHSEWMKPYVAGFYAWKYRGWDLSRAEVEARLEELLALGAREEAVERMPL